MSRDDPARPVSGSTTSWREAVPVLAAAVLFNLGQGVLRPSFPLYLRDVFDANYRMVTLIPVVFGAGKWMAGVPTGYLLTRLGRVSLMVSGLTVIAVCDLASLVVPRYPEFLAVRGVAGAGWAMFATVATTAMVQRKARGRAISLLLMSESLGLLLGSAAGGWLYQSAGRASPFIFEAGCMVLAAVVVGVAGLPTMSRRPPDERTQSAPPALRDVIRAPHVMLASGVNSAVMAVQTGVLVFLFPLYLAERAELAPRAVGAFVALSVLGRVLALWLGGGVFDRHDRLTVLALGLLASGAILATLPLLSAPWLLGAWAFLIGAAGGLVAGLPTAIIGDRVDPSMHGVAIGWLRTVTDTGMLVGPLVMGLVADSVGLEAPFVIAAALFGTLAWTCHRGRGRLT